MATGKRAETHQYASIESNGYKTPLESAQRDRSRIRAWLSGCMLVLSVTMAAPALAAHYPIHKLHTMVSQPGQSKVAFLLDVAHWMRAYSDKTGFEACGMIAKDASRWGVVIGTFGSHVGCRIDKRNIPAGMASISETIHSHPRAGGRYTNAADDILAGMPTDTKVWNTTPKSAENNFSPKDYGSSLAGYLVGTTGLFYQHGQSTQCEIASL